MKTNSSAEDIVQKVFNKVWERRDRIDITKYFRYYLLTIIGNLIIDALKKTSRDKTLIKKM